VTPRPNNAELFGQWSQAANGASLEIIERLQRLEELIGGGSYALRGNVIDENDFIQATQDTPLREPMSMQHVDIVSQMDSEATATPGTLTDIQSLEMLSRGVGVTVYSPVPIYIVLQHDDFES